MIFGFLNYFRTDFPKQETMVSTPPVDNDSDEIEILRLKYTYYKNILDQERERMKIVESKASMFIGSTSILGALLVGCFNLVSQRVTGIHIISIGFLFLMVWFLAKAIIHSIQAVRKRVFYMLEFSDFDGIGNEKEYYETMIEKITIVYKQNQEVVNRKVGHMSEAQSYFKKFWCMVVIYVAFLCVVPFCPFKLIDTQLAKTIDNPFIFALLFGCGIGYLVGNQLYQDESKNELQKRKRPLAKKIKRIVAFLYKKL